MTTTTLEPELEARDALPDFEDEITSETASAPMAGDLETVTAESGAWVAAAPPAKTESPSTTAVEPEYEADPEDAVAEEETETIRILIVDDETAMCAMTSAIVKSMGYLPICVHSGEEAIETFRDHNERDEPFKAIVMDLALPGGISGLEATDAIHELSDEVKVIASSGYLQQNARAAAIERGFAGILPKPYTAERLTAELRWVVTHR